MHHYSEPLHLSFPSWIRSWTEPDLMQRQRKMKNDIPSSNNIQTYFIFKSVLSIFFDSFHGDSFQISKDISLELKL